MNGDVKTFSDLVREVQERGTCGKCGGCASFCSAGEYNALMLDDDGAPKYADEERCLKCGICYLICPQISVLDGELRERHAWAAPIGPIRKMASAVATDEAVRAAGTDGGVVTAMLLHSLERHVIQAAVVSRETDAFGREVIVATTPEEIVAAAGSHYNESRHLHEAGRQYTTFSPTVREIRDVRRQDIRRIAVVGTPCQIRTVRKMQLLNVLPSDTVVLTVGLFCMESFAFHASARARMEEVLGVRLDEIAKLNVKDDVLVTTTRGETLHVPFYLVDEFARPACFACSDFSNEFADVSCGGLGSPGGYTTVLVRSSKGEMVYNGARSARAIQELTFTGPEGRRNHATEMMAKIAAFTNRKRQRARDRLGT